MPDIAWFIIIIILSVGFAVVNGAHDAANAIATVIGTKVLSPVKAIAMAAIMNFAGAAKKAGVRRIIYLGGLGDGARERAGKMP